jgi:alkylation response protein AidB-like acyl-CoA dehydrogenase
VPYQITQEDRAFQQRFDRFCSEQIAPRAREADRTGVVSHEVWRALADSGFLGLFHPRAWGGLGVDGMKQALALESLARACAGTFWATTISTVLCGKMLSELCRPVHQERWLRPIVAGTKIGAFAASEHGAGSDPGSYRTTVERTARGYRLRGEKSRISNACTADVAVVLARQGAGMGGGLCYAVVDLRRDGVHRQEQPKLGLSAMSWGTVCFDDIELPAEDVITDASMERTLISVEWGQVLQAFCALGLAQAALDAAIAHASRREAFGRPIAHMPVVHGRIADMHADIESARLLAYEVARLKGQGKAARELVLMAKIHATEMSVRVVDQAMRTLGGWGYSKEHVVERLYRDSLANVPAGLPTDRLRELLTCPMVGADPWQYAPLDWLTPAGLRILGCPEQRFGGLVGWWGETACGERGAAPAPRRGHCPLHPQRGAAPAPRPREKGLGAPSLLAISHPACVTMRDDLPGHTLHGGLEFTRVSNCVRAPRCTSVYA